MKYSNNLDVEPFLEALEKIRDTYKKQTEFDIFKDAVSLPGVLLKNLLRGTLKKPEAPELYSPNKEGYKMLKGAVVGGPSLVFCRKHEAGQTKIYSDQYKNAKFCKSVKGYDGNALLVYLSTMKREMP